MKKFLSILLVLTLVLSIGVGVFAEPDPETEPDPFIDVDSVTIQKDVNRNIRFVDEDDVIHYFVNPEETFDFTVGDGEYDGPATVTEDQIPSIGNFSITVGQGIASNTIDISLLDFPAVGVYTYQITENGSNTAGMEYDEETYYLQVTVVNDEAGTGLIKILTAVEGNLVKTDAFQNDFYAGDLVITKVITGNYAVYTDEFDVTVVLTPPVGRVIKEGPITVSGAVDDEGIVSVPDAEGKVTVTFKVTDESEVTIANIPYGVTYLVEENSGEYVSNLPDDGFEGIMGEEGEHQVDIVNTLETQIETGINLDNAPYILILAGVAVGLVGFTMKRRLSNDK